MVIIRFLAPATLAVFLIAKMIELRCWLAKKAITRANRFMTYAPRFGRCNEIIIVVAVVVVIVTAILDRDGVMFVWNG
jgi:hypothetical protein